MFKKFILVSSSLRSANSDIEVLCGSQTVDLQILLCPIYFNGYNESLLALNSEHSKHQCKGTPDWTADPPVVKFNFSITEEAISTCSSELTVGYLNLKSPSRCHSHHRFSLIKLNLSPHRSLRRWEPDCLQTSPMSSTSPSQAWSALRTPAQKPSPITRRWCTGSPAVTHCSTWSTILRWACKWQVHTSLLHSPWYTLRPCSCFANQRWIMHWCCGCWWNIITKIPAKLIWRFVCRPLSECLSHTSLKTLAVQEQENKITN